MNRDKVDLERRKRGAIRFILAQAIVIAILLGATATSLASPAPDTFYVGHSASEPTIGVTSDGTPLFAAAEIVSFNGLVPTVDILRGDRLGRPWEIVSPQLGETNVHASTGDPYIYVDNHEEGTRVFTVDLQLYVCSLLSFSDDKGETWQTNPFGCGRPVNDHQTLFAAPPTTSVTIGYPHVVYYCFQDVISSSCTKSLDGGISFVPAGTVSFPGFDEDTGAFCGGLHGHGYGASDGSIYIPKVHCGKPWIAVSDDEGATWSRVLVSDMPAAGHDASVATDRAGNVYYAFIGRDLLPYLATSRDGGRTWRRPVMVGAPGVRESSLPSIATAPDGRVAVAYMGSESRGDPRAATWNAYLVSTDNATSRVPDLKVAQVNPDEDPLLRGECAQTKCGPVYDFIDVVIDRRGSVWAALVDGCVRLCVTTGVGNDASEGLVARWKLGPRDS